MTLERQQLPIRLWAGAVDQDGQRTYETNFYNDVQAKYVEFGRIKLGIEELLPSTQELDGVPVTKPVVKEKLPIFGNRKTLTDRNVSVMLH